MWTETPALKAMKEHGVDKQHLAWISKLWEQHGLQMRPGHVGSNNSKRQGDSRKERQKAQSCSHCWLTQCKQRWTKMVEQRERLQTGRMVFPKRGIRGRHCGIGNITRSSGANDFGPHRRFQRQKSHEIGHANTKWSSTQAKGTMARSGDTKMAWTQKLKNVGTRMSLSGSSAPSVQHCMKQAQETLRKRHNVLCTPYITLSSGKRGLAKYDVERTSMAPNTKLARQIPDTARLRKAEETIPAEWWKERHRKGHITTIRYEMDPNKERKNCCTGEQATWHGQTPTQRHQGHSEQEASNGGRTNKTQIKMGRSTSQKILMLKVGNTKLQNAKNTNMQKQATQKTVQAGYT